MKHTQGKWRLSFNSPASDPKIEIWDENHSLIVSFPLSERYMGNSTNKAFDDTQKAKAEKIMDCVNACENISPKAVPVLLETLGTIACIGTALGSERRANEKLLQVMEFAQEAIQKSIQKAEEK